MATDPDDFGLETLFRAGRNGPAPSGALMERILADAEREAAVRSAPRRSRRRGVVAVVLAVIGGWPALAGMASAAAAGIWVGYSSPGLIDGYLPATQDETISAFLPDYADIALETDP